MKLEQRGISESPHVVSYTGIDTSAAYVMLTPLIQELELCQN